MRKTEFDFVLFGATSFSGKLFCRYMFEYCKSHKNIRWAAAARSSEKLGELRTSLGNNGFALNFIVADASDESSLQAMVQRTQVVVSTVGPFKLYGEPLVKVCAENGVDYCDITGEFPWAREMIDRYENTARRTGARIVHFCGFDSIPSDLGVFHLQQYAKANYGEACSDIQSGVITDSLQLSGGSMATLAAAGAPSKSNMQMLNPYLLCPDESLFSVKQKDIKVPIYNRSFSHWMAPFIMAPVNSKVVHRSNALLNAAYGNHFRYREGQITGKGLKGLIQSLSLTLGTIGLVTVSMSRSLQRLFQNVLPEPGQGPAISLSGEGDFTLRFIGRISDGREIISEVTGDQDPGYGATVKMLAQAGICMARDVSLEQVPGGFWTPASAFGEQLITRLVEDAGMTFKIICG